jgi:hypothetical protein
MRTFHLSRRGGPFAVALALMLFIAPTAKSFAATDWSPIQKALGANGVELPGDVLRFELIRQDLALSLSGTALPASDAAEYTNGFIGFKKVDDSRFFADGALPAQESELPAVQEALRKDTHIHITAIVNHLVLISPNLIWVHFEATENGADLATSLATALKTIHNPQLNVVVIPGVNNIINPSQILPPKFLKLFDEGFVEQLEYSFAFYLPRPDEHRLSVGPVRGETGLDVGQSFYILVPFSGGTNVTLNIALALRADEIQPVEDTLRAGGWTIAAQTNHFVDDQPRLFFVHATASGDGFTLGNTLYDVIQIIQEKSKENRDHGWD